MQVFDPNQGAIVPLLSQHDPYLTGGAAGEANQSLSRHCLGQGGFEAGMAEQVARLKMLSSSSGEVLESVDDPEISALTSLDIPTPQDYELEQQRPANGYGDFLNSSEESLTESNGHALMPSSLNLPDADPSDTDLPATDLVPCKNDGNGSSPPPQAEFPLPDDVQEAGFTAVLKNRNFLVLWSGQVFSQLADKVYLVLMIMIITSRFQTDDQSISGWVSAIMIAFTIPAVLFGSIAGVYVDHWPKKLVLIVTNLLRGGLVLGLPTLLWLTQGWTTQQGLPIGFGVLLVITFFVSTLTQFFAPAEQATIPLVVARKHLLSANSLYTTTMMASVIIGFAVGEPLLAIADSWFPHFGNSAGLGKEVMVGVSYAIAGLLLMLLRTGEKADHGSQPPPHVWENIRDGLRYLKTQSRVRAALLQLVNLFSIFAALAVLAVRMAEIMPAIKSSQFGFLLATGGVGMALGAFLIGHFGHRFSRTQLSLYGSIGMAIALGLMSLVTHRLVPTLVLLMGVGVFAAVIGIPMQTAIQEETPEEMRGKVFGLQNNAVNIALSLPLALAGVAETYFGLQIVFLVLSGMAIAGGLLAWWMAKDQSNVSTAEIIN